MGWGHCGLILAYAQVGRSESDDFVDDDDDDDNDDMGLFINNIIIFERSLTSPPHPLIIVSFLPNLPHPRFVLGHGEKDYLAKKHQMLGPL